MSPLAATFSLARIWAVNELPDMIARVSSKPSKSSLLTSNRRPLTVARHDHAVPLTDDPVDDLREPRLDGRDRQCLRHDHNSSKTPA
ncbi:MAG: hypothetical protein QOH12_2967 [Solirubrobacteraceae bacterium]|nr:hypothetical protein [Solirubrobacteraceae bacterium]